jgi:predicted Fe-Mo cluster-binding NifX family protein
MNVAMAVWQERISPVFDVSRSLRVVRISPEGKEESREEIGIDLAYPSQRVTLLMDLQTEVLICGAVSAPLAEMIVAAGIQLIPFVAGEAEEVLGVFLRGELPSPAYTQPGCCGRRRRCRGGRNWR